MARRILTCLLALLLTAGALGAQEILFDKMVEAGGLKCFPVRGDESTWYYLPDRPHLVVDPDSELPEFSFLMYVAPQQTEAEGITKAPGGGILHFLVAYDVPEDVVRDAERELARKKPGARLAGPVTYQDGRFGLTTAITDPQAGFVRKLVGTGAAPVMAGHKATASMHLTQLGASLLWESFHQSTAPISAHFEMTLSGYYNPVEAKMEVDWEKVNQVLEAGAAGRLSFVAFEVDVMLQKMLQNGAIKIELVGAPPSQWNDIQKIGLDLARSVLFERSGTASVEDLQRLGGGSLLDRYDRGRNRSRSSRLAPWEWPSGFPWALGGTPPFWLRREACWRGRGLFPPATPAPEAGGSQDHGGCSEAQYSEARALFNRAVAAIRGEEWDEAERLLNQAKEHCDASNVHWNLAEVARHRSPPRAEQFIREMENYLSYYEGSPEHAERVQRSRRTLSPLSTSSSAHELEEASNRLSEIWNGVRGRYRPPEDSGNAQIADAPTNPEPSPTPGPRTSAARSVTPSATPATPTPRTRSRSHSTSSSASRATRSTRTPRSSASHRTRTPRSRSTRTPRARSTRTPRTHRTRTPRARRTPTPRAREREQSSSGILVRFRFRRVQRTGKLTLSLKQWHRVTRTVPFDAAFGDLTAYLANPKLFRRVNIDDPVFKQREIPVTVDVAGEEAFGQMLNSVTVTLRKRHQGGRESLDEVTIRRSHIAEGKVPKLLYGWDQDTNRTRWLEYDYRVRWAYVGGPEVDTGWQTTSAGALVLEPPLRPRTILLEADTEMLREAGVRHVTLDLRYDAGGVERRATTTLKPSQLEGERRLVIYQQPDHPEYRYALHWRFRGGRTVASELLQSSDGILYLDEIPES